MKNYCSTGGSSNARLGPTDCCSSRPHFECFVLRQLEANFNSITSIALGAIQSCIRERDQEFRIAISGAQGHAETYGNFGGILAQALGGMTDALVDAALQPQVFLAVAEAKGYRPSAPLPGRVAITGSLRYLEGDRVCVVDRKGGSCLLVFRNESGSWRLVAFEGPLDALKLPGAS